MMLQIGASDPALRRELGAIRNPTLNNFNDKIEGFEQARKTEMSSAHGLVAKGSTPRRQTVQQNSNPSKSAQNKAGGSERSRRAALRGRCFRCSREDHLLPQCSYPSSVKCNTCILSHLQMVLRQLTGDLNLCLRVLARFILPLIGLLQRCLCD